MMEQWKHFRDLRLQVSGNILVLYKAEFDKNQTDTHQGGKTWKVSARDIHIECSKQFKWNLYFYGFGQSGPFWAELKLL